MNMHKKIYDDVVVCRQIIANKTQRIAELTNETIVR